MAKKRQSACLVQDHLPGCKNLTFALFYSWSISTDASHLSSEGAPVHDVLRQLSSLAI